MHCSIEREVTAYSDLLLWVCSYFILGQYHHTERVVLKNMPLGECHCGHCQRCQIWSPVPRWSTKTSEAALKTEAVNFNNSCFHRQCQICIRKRCCCFFITSVLFHKKSHEDVALYQAYDRSCFFYHVTKITKIQSSVFFSSWPEQLYVTKDAKTGARWREWQMLCALTICLSTSGKIMSAGLCLARADYCFTCLVFL